jgi:hypothetical protein
MIKIKLPFVNRNRYIVVKAYTINKRFLDNVPIVLTKDVKDVYNNSKKLTEEEKRIYGTFNTCYGRVAALRRSITLKTWCEFEIKTNENKFDLIYPNGFQYLKIEEQKDLTFNPPGVFILKIQPPWMFEFSKKDLNVVLASHILNTTPLQATSGIIPGHSPSTNFFSYIPKQRLHFMIPYKMPIVQWYPLTDLPIHVESYYDVDKFEERFSMATASPYKVASAMKCMKYENTSL